jgi:glucose-6-phosphate isomerase
MDKKIIFLEQINYTEQRAAMHWALRLPDSEQYFSEINRDVHEQLERMYALVAKIHAGQYRGATGEVIQDVVNIGVGGSDLGPLMVTHALSDFKVATAKPLGIHLCLRWMVVSSRIYCINFVLKQLIYYFIKIFYH